MTEQKTPILLSEGDYRLIRFELNREFVITRKSKASFISRGRVQTLFFTEAMFWHDTSIGEAATFPSGTSLYTIAKLQGGSYYAQAVCDRELYELFSCYPKLGEKLTAMKSFFAMREGARNNIFIQMGRLKRSPKTELEDLATIQEYNLKANLCEKTMPPDLVKKIRNKARSSTDRVFVPECDDLNILANIYYGESRASAIDKEFAKAFLLDKTFMDDDNAEKLAIALSRERDDRELRILLEGPDNCGQEQIIQAISELKNRPVCRASFSGISAALEIVGEIRSFREASTGIPLELYMRSQTTEVILVYDDLGGLGESVEHGSAKAAARKILGCEYFDANFRMNVPIGASLIIATTQRVDDLNHAVRGMFDVKISLSLSDEDKVYAVKKCFLNDITRGTGVRFSEAALLKVADYCDDYGLDRIIDYLRHLVSRAGKDKTIDESFVVQELSLLAEVNSPYMLFKLHKDKYTEAIACAIEETNKRVVAKGAAEKKDYDYLCERLEMLSKLRRDPLPFSFDRDGFFADVNESHYGLEYEKAEIADYLTTRALLRPKNNLQLYFVGPPGCGKSTLAAAAVKAQGVKEICRIDLSAVSTDEVLGLPNSYQGGGHPSIITSSLIKAGNSNIAIILEEFEKASHGVINVFLKILDDDHCFRDKYLDVDIDLTGVTVIATANGTDVQLCSLDRFRIFHFDALSKRVKEGVFDKAIRRIEAESLSRALSIHVTPDAKQLIIDKYAQASSARELSHKLQRITEHVIAGVAVDSTDEPISITIDGAAVREAFPEEPFIMGNFGTTPDIPGVIRGLAVSGDSSGITFGIEAAVYESSCPGLNITGLADETVSEQVSLACSYINMHYNGILEGKRICIHFGEGSVQKRGCSAGAATLLSLLSAALNIPVDRRIAVTGEISLHGGVKPVGGIQQKADGAIRDGCRTMIMPAENIKRLSAADREYLEKSIALVGVSSVDELIKLTMPGIDCSKAK